MRYPELVVHLPEWLEKSLPAPDKRYATAEDRMRLVIGLARENVARGGGPFAAAVFEMDGESGAGRLVAPGVNMVLLANCSILHAEMVAVAIAQRIAGSYDLAADPAISYELVSSTEPCAMCLGAIPWSGVSRLVCGAKGEDAGAIGFDEGEKPPKWEDALKRRGISVESGVCRDEAKAVLAGYAEGGGIIYNSRRKG